MNGQKNTLLTNLFYSEPRGKGAHRFILQAALVSTGAFVIMVNFTTFVWHRLRFFATKDSHQAVQQKIAIANEESASAHINRSLYFSYNLTALC